MIDKGDATAIKRFRLIANKLHRLDHPPAISRSDTALRSPTPQQIRCFDAVFLHSRPSFQEICSEEIERTPFGRCILRVETIDSIAFGVALRFNGQPIATKNTRRHKNEVGRHPSSTLRSDRRRGELLDADIQTQQFDRIAKLRVNRYVGGVAT